MKWIQKNGQRVSDRYRALKATRLCKETVKSTTNCNNLHDVLQVKGNNFASTMRAFTAVF